MNKYTISCIESNKENAINESALFLIQPLEVGHGITLGNALRRSLLSDLTGYAVSSFRINALSHEFSVLPSLREDVMEIMLNLKQLVFQASPLVSTESAFFEPSNQKLKAILNVKGPRIVTASMLLLPYSYLTLLNPNQYICTIVDDSTFSLEIDIEKGKAYKLAENAQKEASFENLDGAARTIFTDSLYSPVKNVNYKIKLINDSKGNIKEALLMDITTNGSISPNRALQEASKILLDLIGPLLLTSTFEKLSEEFLKIQKLKESFSIDNSFELEENDSEEKNDLYDSYHMEDLDEEDEFEENEDFNDFEKAESLTEEKRNELVEEIQKELRKLEEVKDLTASEDIQDSNESEEIISLSE